jgi:hypothetical protein
MNPMRSGVDPAGLRRGVPGGGAERVRPAACMSGCSCDCRVQRRPRPPLVGSPSGGTLSKWHVTAPSNPPARCARPTTSVRGQLVGSGGWIGVPPTTYAIDQAAGVEALSCSTFQQLPKPNR